MLSPLAIAASFFLLAFSDTPTMGDSSPLSFARAPGKPRCRYGDAFCTMRSMEHWRSFDHHETHQFLQLATPVHSGSETEEDDEASTAAPLMQPPTGAASPVSLGSDTDGEEAASGARTLSSVVEQIVRLGTFRGVGLIVGPTGSGKTRLLNSLAKRGVVSPAAEKEVWPEHRSVVSYLAERCGGVQAAMSRLNAVGLNTVPEWVKPFSALSNGQQARAPHRSAHCATDQRATPRSRGLHMHSGRSGAHSHSHSSRACSATTSAASLSRA